MERKLLIAIPMFLFAMVTLAFQISVIAGAIGRADACREMNVLSRLPDDPAKRPELFKASSIDSTEIAFQMVEQIHDSNGASPSIAEAREYLTNRYQQYLKAKERCSGHRILIPEGTQDLY